MLHAIDAARPGLFDVDFAHTPRRDEAWWRIWSLFEKREAVVDGWAIGQAVRHAIGRCNTFTVAGKRQVWNEYRLFLHPADLDRVRPAVSHMVGELGELIREEIARHEAHTIGRIEVRLLSDSSRTIPPGRAQLACGLRADGEEVRREDGETTLRFDSQGRASVRDHGRSGEATLPSSAVVLRGGGQVVHLPEGRTVTLGRAAEPNPPDHLTVPGATRRVSRRHLEVHVDGAQVRVTALPDAATSVNGRPLSAAEVVAFTLAPGVPVPLVLANEVRVDLERAR
jgi:hypothetical protein